MNQQNKSHIHKQEQKKQHKKEFLEDTNNYIRLPRIIEAKENLNPQNWANVKNEYLLSPILGGDGRVLIRQDDFKSRFDCASCDGKGHTNETCPYCLGTKYDKGKSDNGPCRDCTIGEGDGRITYGKVPCSTCSGKGGTIVIPDDAKSDTTMGNIIAISMYGIKHVKINDKVMYHIYTGIKFKFLEQTFRVAMEKDLLCLVKQMKKSTDIIQQESYADLDNTGVAHDD